MTTGDGNPEQLPRPGLSGADEPSPLADPTDGLEIPRSGEDLAPVAASVLVEGDDGWTRPRVNKQVLARKRVPYFHRPKQPHDWRWWVGGIGRSLIVTGLLMFAFVGYQLWGTGIETARAQASLEDDFNSQLEQVSTTSTTAPADTQPGDSSTTSTIPIAEPHNFQNSDVIAKIVIPKMKLDYYVVEGVRMKDLKKGPGHFKETPMPGQLGNAAIAGHRTTYGHPFYRLDDLHPGDDITIKMVTGGTFVYRVTGKEIVEPNEYARVIPTKDPDIATLTLATCHPVYTARQRLIVYATLVEELSDPVTRPGKLGTPDEDGLSNEGGGQTTETTPSVTQPDTSQPDTSQPDVTDDATTDTTPTTFTDATTAPGDGEVESDGDDGIGVGGPEVDDTFSQGWFSDTAAIPHVLGWGLLLALVAIGAYYVGRSVKRLYVCFLVGFAPFLLVLFFFFQNVNRLLPPGL